MNQVKNCPKARIVFKVFESDSYTEGHWKLEKVMESHGIWRDKKTTNPVPILSIIPVAKMETIAKWRLVNPPALIQSCLG